VIRAALGAAVEEASAVVVRSSHSTFIQEGADACAALLDATGRLVAQSTATSLMHSCSLSSATPALLAAFPLATLRPGDVLATNDPYRGGIHANDVLLVEPIFAADRETPVFLAGTLIHVADLGGAVAGGLAATATDMYQEGLLLPPVKLYEAGEPVAEIWAILAANSRMPDKVLGDIRALASGTRVITQRVADLCDRFGAETVTRVGAEWMDYAETRVRQELATLPDGVWLGSYTIETDGVDHERAYTVAVTATIAGDRCCLDFEGTSSQARGAINSSISQSLSGAVYALRCFIDPTIPMNEGCFRALEVRLPHGSIVNPRSPAACGGRIVTVTAAIEAIVEALAGARPDLAVAASGLVHVYTLAGTRADVPWVTMLYEFGGLGARVGSDGPDATGAYLLGGRSVVPQIEPIEASCPLIVRSTALRDGSGGAGRWRGGRGIEQVIEVTESAVVTVRGDRMTQPPRGRAGGAPGAPGLFAVRRADGMIEPLRPKHENVVLGPGDTLVVATSGGGGLGDPVLDDTDAVDDEGVQ
jgi:N-methylhydantoinase B